MKLTFIQRIFCYLTFFGLLISGIIWVILRLFVDFDSPFYFLSSLSLKLHGLFAFGFILVFGMITSTHISFNWQVKKNRYKSGIFLFILLFLLIISGYFLYYLGEEFYRNITSYFHIILGITCFLAFIIHLLSRKKITIPKHKSVDSF